MFNNTEIKGIKDKLELIEGILEVSSPRLITDILLGKNSDSKRLKTMESKIDKLYDYFNLFYQVNCKEHLPKVIKQKK